METSHAPSNKMKYLMFTNNRSGIKAPVIFAKTFSHCDFTAPAGWTATSAGFVSMEGAAFGKSDSTGLSAVDSDSVVLQAVIGNMESMLIAVQDTADNFRHLSEVEKLKAPLNPGGPSTALPKGLQERSNNNNSRQAFDLLESRMRNIFRPES